MRAANDAASGKNQKSGGRRFHEPLEPIPIRLRDFPQFIAGIEDQIENHQREISVAQKQVGGRNSVAGLAAADPK